MAVKASGVYSIINILTSRAYVGSSINMYERHNAHFHSLKGGRHENKHLQSDFNLFGLKAFQFKVLEECAISELPKREKFYMESLNVLDPSMGYNIMPEPYNGYIPAEVRLLISQKATGRKLPESAKVKIGNFHRGKVISAETRAKMSKSQTGKKKSDECKEKCRLVNLGRKRSPETRAKYSAMQNYKKKAVYCCDRDDGELLIRFESLKQAEWLTGISSAAITRACKGTYKQSGGYTWKYANTI